MRPPVPTSRIPETPSPDENEGTRTQTRDPRTWAPLSAVPRPHASPPSGTISPSGPSGWTAGSAGAEGRLSWRRPRPLRAPLQASAKVKCIKPHISTKRSPKARSDARVRTSDQLSSPAVTECVWAVVCVCVQMCLLCGCVWVGMPMCMLCMCVWVCVSAWICVSACESVWVRVCLCYQRKATQL